MIDLILEIRQIADCDRLGMTALPLLNQLLKADIFFDVIRLLNSFCYNQILDQPIRYDAFLNRDGLEEETDLAGCLDSRPGFSIAEILRDIAFGGLSGSGAIRMIRFLPTLMGQPSRCMSFRKCTLNLLKLARTLLACQEPPDKRRERGVDWSGRTQTWRPPWHSPPTPVGRCPLRGLAQTAPSGMAKRWRARTSWPLENVKWAAANSGPNLIPILHLG